MPPLPPAAVAELSSPAASATAVADPPAPPSEPGVPGLPAMPAAPSTPEVPAWTSLSARAPAAISATAIRVSPQDRNARAMNPPNRQGGGLLLAVIGPRSHRPAGRRAGAP